MALKTLFIRSQLKKLNPILTGLREKAKEWEKREQELAGELDKAENEDAVTEIEQKITALEEEQKQYVSAVNDLVAEAKVEGFTEAGAEIEEQVKKLEEKVSALESELTESETRTEKAVHHVQTRSAVPLAVPEINHNGGYVTMGTTIRSRVESLVQREGVKKFLEQVRARATVTQETRSVQGANLTVPVEMLPLIRERVEATSKLYKYVRVKPVKGEARQNVTVGTPEGVWTEATGKLNAIGLTFNQMEFDGYKVGGFVPIPNPNLEDSDIDLAAEIIDILGAAIARGLDKGIVYGTGVKMPMGIVTRLAQTEKPSNWANDAPAWTDLHTTNILSFTSTEAAYSDAKFFSTFIKKASVMKSKHAESNDKIWIMNEQTHMKLLANALAFNAAGALVAGMNDTMPILNGHIIELDFMADGDILGGYAKTYTLIDRKSVQLAQSKDCMFIEDQTVFKGTARYDGAPVFGEGFVAINISGGTFKTSENFAEDTANKTETDDTGSEG